MSLVPPIGGVGTAITPTQSSTLGVGTKKSQTAAITQNLVKQINAVSAARKVNQQQLLQLVNQLKQSIAQDESNEETSKRKLTKEGIKPSTIGTIGGSIIGGVAGGAAGAFGGPVGIFAGRAAGAGIGGEIGKQIANKIAPDKNGEDDEEKSKKNKRRKLNNKKDTLMANKNSKSNVQEGTIGRLAGSALGGAGGTVLGGLAGTVVGGPIGGIIGSTLGGAAGSLKGAQIAGGGTGISPEQNEQTSKQGHSVHALLQNGFRVTHTKHEDHGDVVVLTKKTDKHTTRTAEVEPDGSVSGGSLDSFLGHDQDENTLGRTLGKAAGAGLGSAAGRVAGGALGRTAGLLGGPLAPITVPLGGAIGSAIGGMGGAKAGWKTTGAVQKKAGEIGKKLMHKEAVTTTNFLKAISQKNYAQADKYLGSLVNEKLKRIINKASK